MVYDCFPFFNELDALEIRLNVLKDVVDKHVLVESDRTFSNRPKLYYFEENKERFTPFLDKIIHIKLHEYPPVTSDWVIENYQRNMIIRGLTECQPDDVIIISDLDEIPNPDAIKRYPKDGVYTFEQTYFTCFLNNKTITVSKWYGSNILRWSDLQSAEIDKHPYTYSNSFLRELNEGVTPTKIRFIRDFPVIKNGGWHFSYLGGIDRIKYKIQSFAHQELNTPGFNADALIEEKIRRGLDLFDRKDLRYLPVKLDASFPRYIVENAEKYKALIIPITRKSLERNFFMRIYIFAYYHLYRRPYKAMRALKKKIVAKRAGRP